MELDMIIQIVKNFNIEGNIIDIALKNKGNINKTYIITTDKRKYILQRINSDVFKDPVGLMENIKNVTSWIKNKMIQLDINKPCLELIQTNDGYFLEDNGEYYRMYNYIDNSISYDVSNDSEVVYNTGKAFGNFQKLLIDYPVETINETIKDFHNTEKRYCDFVKIVEKDEFDRVSGCMDEIKFINENSYISSLITDLIDNGSIPLKITHNDTKINNVMMDKSTNDFLTVVDLDTVMVGSSLYDYGDAVRSCCSNTSEDETNLYKVGINLDLFKVYTDGYLSEIGPYLTPVEVKNMANSILVITYELSLRFLSDYINGDQYFTTKYDNHNLDRARNQMMLFRDMSCKYKLMNEYIITKYNEIIQNKVKVKKYN